MSTLFDIFNSAGVGRCLGDYGSPICSLLGFEPRSSWDEDSKAFLMARLAQIMLQRQQLSESSGSCQENVEENLWRTYQELFGLDQAPQAQEKQNVKENRHSCDREEPDVVLEDKKRGDCSAESQNCGRELTIQKSVRFEVPERQEQTAPDSEISAFKKDEGLVEVEHSNTGTSQDLNAKLTDTTQDQTESEQDFQEVHCWVKGFSPDEVSVKIKDRVLLLQAKHEEGTKDSESYVLYELKRKFQLPEDANPNDVSCEMNDDGLLKLKAPFTIRKM